MNQLAKEGRWLERNAEDHQKVLILLAPAISANEIYANTKSNINFNKIIFGYITWENVYDALVELIEIGCLNPYQKVVIDDLVKLLEHKRFDGFRGFAVRDLCVDSNAKWVFNDSFEFSFVIEKNIEKGLYYEFEQEHSRCV